MSEKAKLITDSISSDTESKKLISEKVLLEFINNIQNQYGQMKFEETKNTVSGSNTLIFSKGSITYHEFLLDQYGLEANNTLTSAVSDSVFINCMG